MRKLDRKKSEVTFAVMNLTLEPQKHEDKNKQPPPPVAQRDLQEFTTSIAGFKFVTVGGKELSENEGWDRLKIGSAVIVSPDPKGVDPVFLSVLSKDALMLVADLGEKGEARSEPAKGLQSQWSVPYTLTLLPF